MYCFVKVLLFSVIFDTFAILLPIQVEQSTRMNRLVKTILFLALLAHTPIIRGQEDTIYSTIPEVTLIGHRNLSAISGTMASGLRIDAKLMETYPRMFGFTDPVLYLQSLPGVSTNSEQSSGLHVQGGESSHNIITVSDIPVYGNMSFTGLFSLFNQDHLPQVMFSTSSRTPHIGAHLSMDHIDTIPARLSGTASLGLISGQGTLHAPLSADTYLTLSLRRSFINTVYGSLLEFDGNPLEYGFTDANLTLMHRIDSRNTIDLNALWSHDVGRSIYGVAKLNMECIWGNTLASFRWKHQGKRVSSKTILHYSRYNFNGNVKNEIMTAKMNSNITDAGISTVLNLPHKFNLDAGLSMFNILPQDPHVTGNKEIMPPQPVQKSFLGNLAVNRQFTAGRKLEITPHLLLSAYDVNEGYESINLDPALTIGLNLFRYGSFTVESGIKHQYISQTGISSTGLPNEFWLSTGRYFKPQQSVFGTLTYDLDFKQSMYVLSAQLYGKLLTNQLEYTGFLYDLLTRPYRLEDNLLICSGYNYGINLMLAKQAGKTTGWISYSYGQSIRRGDGVLFPSYFHSSHERTHELNAVLSHKVGRFDLGGNLTMASGNPYTPAKNLYLLSNSLFIYYDQYNSARLPMYMRLDLSATYNLPRRHNLLQSINLSVFNATAHNNYTMGYIRADEDKQTIRYKLAKLVIPTIPSISYSCRF